MTTASTAPAPAAAPAFNPSTAKSCPPFRHPDSKRTVFYLQPGEGGVTDCFTITGLYAGVDTAPSSGTPATPPPKEPAPPSRGTKA